MAALLAVPSEPLKKREGLRHLMATSLLCHLPRYTCTAAPHSVLGLSGCSMACKPRSGAAHGNGERFVQSIAQTGSADTAAYISMRPGFAARHLMCTSALTDKARCY